MRVGRSTINSLSSRHNYEKDQSTKTVDPHLCQITYGHVKFHVPIADTIGLVTMGINATRPRDLNCREQRVGMVN